MPRFANAIAVATALGLGLGLAACQSRSPETPEQAVQSILALYETRDFDKLVRTRYAELSKAENEQQIEQLIGRIRSAYEGDGNLDRAIAIYESLLSRTPELSEDGNVATYPVENGFVKLSRMPDGRWGFHL